jgi:S-adenosylmethionine/arginine decarboxylase-like enzyme
MRTDTHAVFARARAIGAAPSPPFGYLLMADCYDCYSPLMLDIGAAYWLLDTLANSLGMTKQAPPFVFMSPADFPDKAGISGWVPLIESGIQIHTLARKNFVSLDVYCCRKINRDIVVDVLMDCYGSADISLQEVKRGTWYHG